MNPNTLTIKFSFFDQIHISQQGAVINGADRSVSIESCFFNDIITPSGGSCIDLSSSSSLYLSSNCFRRCKNTNSANDSFANIVKFLGTYFLLSQASSYLCADTTDAGDSSFFAASTELSMSDCNSTSNYSPYGASALRTGTVNSQKQGIAKRIIDIDSAISFSFEAASSMDLSYSSFLNTTQNQYILVSPDLCMSWCIFINQCSGFSYNKIKSASNCYSDIPRTELQSTTDKFSIPFNNIDYRQCRVNIEMCQRFYSSRGSIWYIWKQVLFSMVLLDEEVLLKSCDCRIQFEPRCLYK